MRPTELQRIFALKYDVSEGVGHPEEGGGVAAQPAGSVDKRPNKEKRGWTSPKNEAASNTAAKSAGSDDSRPVRPRGSVLQQSGTKLAGMATRSGAVQTRDPTCEALSTDTQTLDDGRSHIQGQYWVELQKVQHNNQYALNKRRDSGRSSGSLTPRQRCWNR